MNIEKPSTKQLKDRKAKRLANRKKRAKLKKKGLCYAEVKALKG